MVAIKNLSKQPKKEKIKDKPKKSKNILQKKGISPIPLEKAEQKEHNKDNKTSPVIVKKKKAKYIYPSKGVTPNILDSCLDALNKLTDHYNTKNIFGDESPIFMQIRCIKIQNTKGNIKFVLPHSTVASSGEVCLITPDLKKGKKIDHEPTVEHWEEILRKAGVTSVKTVLPMRQLRVEYDQFELRRRLMTQHDFIMVDTRVLNHVSHLLGGMFFKKHNMLVPVKINENKDIKKDLDVGLRSAMLRLNEGPISNIVVGHTAMPAEHIKENILAIIKQFHEKYPGGEANIRSLCLKLPLSLSLPLYMTLRSSNLISAPKIKKNLPKEYQFYEDELSTIPGSKVKVGPDGTVHLKKTQEKDGSSDEEMEDDSEGEALEDLSENEDE